MRALGAAGGPVEGLTLVRVARPGVDLLAKLAEYELEAFGKTGLRTYDLAVMAEAGVVFAAYVGEEIVGGCQLLRTVDEPKYFYVVGLYVRPGWQDRRLGKALLLAVAREIRAAGAEGMRLTVAPENRRAMRLYQSAGFVDETLVADFFGSGEDRHILRWRFGEGGLHGSV